MVRRADLLVEGDAAESQVRRESPVDLPGSRPQEPGAVQFLAVLAREDSERGEDVTSFARGRLPRDDVHWRPRYGGHFLVRSCGKETWEPVVQRAKATS